MPEESGAVGGSGKYDFGIYVRPVGDGVQQVKFFLDNGFDYLVGVELVDNNGVAAKGRTSSTISSVATQSFNSVAFATNGSATALVIEDVFVDMTDTFDMPEVSVSIDDPGVELPAIFSLEQNYPNPFNPTTNIKFNLPEASDVKLVVYNMLGQQVGTLVNSNLPAGSHQVMFDARSLASGMYVYRMEAGNFVSTQKMMLLK